MQVFALRDPEALRPRSHPWSHAEGDSTHRYVDFRRHPERIRTSLEDWRPWEQYAATETFYRLIEWLDGPASVFDTNDCAFNGVVANESPLSSRSLECSGRVMILFRDLAANTSPEKVEWLAQAVAISLSEQEPGFASGAFGVTPVSVRYVTLDVPEARKWGQQLMLSFWAWGDEPAETLNHLDRTLGCLSAALRAVSNDLGGDRARTGTREGRN